MKKEIYEGVTAFRYCVGSGYVYSNSLSVRCYSSVEIWNVTPNLSVKRA